MLNHTDTLKKLAIEAFETAARNLEAACKAYRKNANGPMADLYEMRMDEAQEAFERAADDKREICDGYRHTYPHPVALAPHGSRYPVR
jgi:hypothetical protein